MRGLFLLLPVLVGIPGEAQAGRIPDCVKYIYLDVDARQGSTAPLMACSEVTNGRAHSCNEIGGLDFDRVYKAARDVKNWSHFYYTAWGLTMACYAAAYTVPAFLPRGPGSQISSDLWRDYQDALTKMAATAKKNAVAGIRPTGTFANRYRGEIVETRLGRRCREEVKGIMASKPGADPMARAAANFAVDVVYNYWFVNDVQAEMQRGDLRAIAHLYGMNTEIYKQKVRELNAQNLALQKAQQKIFDDTVAAAKALHTYMNEPTDLPLGLSPEVTKKNPACMAKEEIAKVRGMVCKLVKAMGVFESYKPADKFYLGASPNFLVDSSRAAKTAKFIHENCEGGPVERGNKEVGKVNDPNGVLP